MRTNKALASAVMAVTLTLPSLANDQNNTSITSDELAHVIGGVITLKAQCIIEDKNACEQSDAIMKMFKSYTSLNSNISDDEKKQLYLLMQSFVDGFIDGIVEAKAQEKDYK